MQEEERSGFGQSSLEVTGMVLSSTPAGEYDRRLVVLTRERGRIHGFARGARRPGNAMMAASSPFAFGTFRVTLSGDLYYFHEARILNYFEKLREDMTGTCYGSYFLEVMNYVTRENLDESQNLLLTYQSLRALESEAFSDKLVRAVFEIRTVYNEGEYGGPEPGRQYSPACEQALYRITGSPIAKLYSFSVSDSVLSELTQVATYCMSRSFAHHFQSLDILSVLQ